MLVKRKRASSLYTRKFRAKKAITAVPRNVLPGRIPYTWASLNYTDHPYVLNPGAAGTCAVTVFAANGLYDPDITGIGHQPSGFDQFMALYNEYVVTEASIEATFENTDTSYSQICGISLQDFATVATDCRVYTENGNVVTTVIGQAGGASAHIKTLKITCNQKFISKLQNILTENDFAGTASANPVDTAHFHVFCAPMNASVDAASVYARVVIKYKVLFRDPKLNALS